MKGRCDRLIESTTEYRAEISKGEAYNRYGKTMKDNRYG